MAEENNKNMKGLATFEDGSGNNMQVEFLEVIEAETHMNIGVALMPFMEDGYYFLKEDGRSDSSTAEGLNEVELDFVKYLYKIRKTNRASNKKLDYTWFAGPTGGGSIRDRIFIAGTIFPVMSIGYSGKDIDCSSSKIKLKTTSFGELRVRFGEMFDQYKPFSINYISIDNDNICIFLPKDSVMDIDYAGLMIDFLKNGDKTKKVTNHGEFPDMETYTLATDKNALQDGCWLTKDRKSNNGTWETACMYILENKLKGVLAPFGQIADFYTLLDKKITDETEHKTRWLKGAKKLVNSLKIMDGGFMAVSNDVETILNELNIGICEYAITQFYELFYGKYKDDPLNTAEKAYDFDLQFVTHEQGTVAVPIYEKTTDITIDKYQDMADQDARGSHGFGGFIMDKTPLKVIPEFDEPWNGKVTDAEFRIDLPMLMLWLDRHKPKSKNFKDKVDEHGFLLEKYKLIIEDYEAK